MASSSLSADEMMAFDMQRKLNANQVRAAKPQRKAFKPGNQVESNSPSQSSTSPEPEASSTNQSLPSTTSTSPLTSVPSTPEPYEDFPASIVRTQKTQERIIIFTKNGGVSTITLQA
jgi:hypothetical protein